MKVSVHIEEWEMKEPFRISNYDFTNSRSIVVELSDGQHSGRGEAQGAFYLNETAEGMRDQVNELFAGVKDELNRTALQELMPPCGARNAVDCALWDLECKQQGKTIWELTGIEPGPVTTVYTIGLEDSPEAMAAKAAAAAEYPVLKIKLSGHLPYEKLAAIRAARPDAALVVDANQGWSFDQLKEILPKCAALDLGMIEQPLPRGADECLEGFESPVTLAADESCLHRGELEAAARRYDMINIKLDKTGGLTEALYLARAAKEKGLKLMVGNMMGTSVSMAPSFVIARLCDFVDIDGPLLLRYDHPDGLNYEQGRVDPFDSTFWG